MVRPLLLGALIGSLAAVAMPGLQQVQAASLPPELLQLESEGRLTVRALRAWGLLGEAQQRLALELRGQGLDLLAADRVRIEEWLAAADAGRLALSVEQRQELAALAESMRPERIQPVDAQEEVGETGVSVVPHTPDEQPVRSEPAAVTPATVGAVATFSGVVSGPRIPAYVQRPDLVFYRPALAASVAEPSSMGDVKFLVTDGKESLYFVHPFEGGRRAAVSRVDLESLSVVDTIGPLVSEEGELAFVNGLALDPQGNLLLTVLTGDLRIHRFAGDGRLLQSFGVSGTAEEELRSVFNIDVDGSGIAYVVHEEGTYNAKGIKTYDPSGRFVNYLRARHGPEPERFRRLRDVKVAADGSLYIKDSDTVKRMSPSGELLNVFRSPEGELSFGGDHIAIDAEGHVFVADSDNRRVLKFSPDGGLRAIWGGIGVGDGQFLNLSGIAVDAAGAVYVLDGAQGTLQKFVRTDEPPAPMLSEHLHLATWRADGAHDIAVGPDGGLWVLVRRLEQHDGQSVGVVEIGRVDEKPAAALRFEIRESDVREAYFLPETFDVAPSGELLLLDPAVESNVVRIVDTEGKVLRAWGEVGDYDRRAEPGVLRMPNKIRAEPGGSVLIADPMKFGALRFDSDGRFLVQAGQPRERFSLDTEGYPQYPEDAYATADGYIYIPDKNQGVVQIFRSDGSFDRMIASSGWLDGELSIPLALVVDSRSRIIVADSQNRRLQAFHEDGSLAAVIGTAGGRDGYFDRPTRLAIAPDDSFFVLDGDRIQHFAPLP